MSASVSGSGSEDVDRTHHRIARTASMYACNNSHGHQEEWTLSRALNMTVPTVIAGQVQPIRTTVEQPRAATAACGTLSTGKSNLPSARPPKAAIYDYRVNEGAAALRWLRRPFDRSTSLAVSLPAIPGTMPEKPPNPRVRGPIHAFALSVRFFCLAIKP